MHNNPDIAVLLAQMHHTSLAPISPGLQRTAALLATLGNPHHHLPPVIHVAGTNGKGSTLAYLTAIFKEAGLRLHRYTSPHLIRFNERIMLNYRDIGDDALLAVLQRVQPLLADHPATLFEATTAAAFLAFADHPADILLLETGLGGRLDATNVIDTPLLTVITAISYDHMEYLGDKLEQIAAEKAGIIKPGVPCIVGRNPPEVMAVIEKTAAGKNAPLFVYGKDWHVENDCYHSDTHTIPLAPSLPGAHQFDNAGLAVACVKAMPTLAAPLLIPPPPAEPLFIPPPLAGGARGGCLSSSQHQGDEGHPPPTPPAPRGGVKSAHIEAGIRNATWPARLQRLNIPGLTDGWQCFLDGGHNPAAGVMLAEWAIRQPQPFFLICGMLQGKDTTGFLHPFAPITKAIYTVNIQNEPNAQPAETLASAASSIGIKAKTAASVKDALAHITATSTTGTILIAGSLYLAGEVLAAYE